jgi:predicted nucleic acid-binding protein
MIVVSDTSCIINLAIVNRLSLLRSLFQEVIIPDAVYNEIVVDGSTEPGADEVKNANWISSKKCHNKLLLGELLKTLDEGESEAIVLAIELNATLLLIDEEKGRKEAERLKIQYTGLLGVLLIAKEKGLLTEIKPIIDELMLKAEFRISPKLYREVLTLAQENK